MTERLTASEREALVARVRYVNELSNPDAPIARRGTGDGIATLRHGDIAALCDEVERLTRERDAWRRLVRDDGYAMTFQSLSQYRNALLTAIDAARTTGGTDA